MRLSRPIAGEHDLQALKLAMEAASAAGLPLMAHIGDTHTPRPVILSELSKGDVVTHRFRGGNGGVLDDQGIVLKEVRSAMARGVHLDVGHGAGSFSFDTAEKALKQGFIMLPGVLRGSVSGRRELSKNKDLVKSLLWINQILIKLSKGLFSYQMYMTIKPKLGLAYLLKNAQEYSEKLA